MPVAFGQSGGGGGGAGTLTSINGDGTAAQLITSDGAGNDVSVATAAGTTTISVPSASATKRGALLSADWTTFNGKIGGSSGGVDNAIIRCDGAVNTTIQGSATTIADTTGTIQLPANGEINYGGLTTYRSYVDTTAGLYWGVPTSRGYYWNINNVLKNHLNAGDFQCYVDFVDADINTHHFGYRTADGFPYPFKSGNFKSLYLQSASSAVTLSAASTTLTVTNISHIRLNSNDTTAANRLIALPAPDNTNRKGDGQFLMLVWQSATNQAQLAGSGTNWALTGGVAINFTKVGDLVLLFSDSGNTMWNEVTRSLK